MFAPLEIKFLKLLRYFYSWIELNNKIDRLSKCLGWGGLDCAQTYLNCIRCPMILQIKMCWHWQAKWKKYINTVDISIYTAKFFLRWKRHCSTRDPCATSLIWITLLVSFYSALKNILYFQTVLYEGCRRLLSQHEYFPYSGMNLV